MTQAITNVPVAKPNLWQRLWRLKRQCLIKVYHGYGDDDQMMIFGHVLLQYPREQQHFRKAAWRNTVNLLRLFMIKPYPNAQLQLHFQNTTVNATSDANGFFRCEWQKDRPLDPGWHEVTVTITSGYAKGTVGVGKLYHPPRTRFGVVSDIDDTFLISHSARMHKRLFVLLTRNPRTRKPFEGVVLHYRALALAHTRPDAPNPFFYVSSSEWNLYEYIKEFCRHHEMPEGIFLLSTIKKLSSFWKTGQGRHKDKYFRIARIMKTYEHLPFVLLGDDSQEDPQIYAQLVKDFPKQVLCVYIRHRNEHNKEEAGQAIAYIKTQGVDACYFVHSEQAMAHSQQIGLTTHVET